MRHTQEQMQAAIKEWRQSGLSKKTFCKQQNFTYPTFHYWCKRLKEVPAGGFTEVKIERVQASGCEVIFPSGTRMVFQGEPSVCWLRELVR